MRASRIWLSPGAAVFAGLGALLLLAFARRPSPAALTRLDALRVREYQRLQRIVGERVWPGWSRARIPVAIIKGGRVFLFDHPAPPAGFTPLRDPSGGGAVAGTLWGGTLDRGLPRLALTALPVAGVPTLVATDKATFDPIAGLGQVGHGAAVLELLTSGAPQVPDTALYEIVLMHEGFHALQQQRGFAKLSARLGHAADPLDEEEARAALRDVEARQDVAALLAEAVAARDPVRRKVGARAWLGVRAARREATAAQLGTLDSANLAAYEQQNEWLEGMARYTEQRVVEELLAMRYEPTPDLSRDPDFGGYAILGWRPGTSVLQAFERGSRERAYVLGSALCALLDRLGADWKEAALDAGEPLECLVARQS